MAPNRNLGNGNHDSLDTPPDVHPVDSGSWRRDKAKFQEWLMTFVVLLLVSIVTGGFITYSDITTRLVRVETKLDLIQDREGHRESSGSVAGTANTPRNTP